MLEVADGVVERGGVERPLAGDRQVAHQACPVGGPSGMGQVVGEIPGVCLEIVGVAPRDCLGRP